MLTLSKLNEAEEDVATELLVPLIERAPKIAKLVADHRPFQSIDALRAAIQTELVRLDEAERINLFRAHPELAPDNPLSMTGASQSEQGRLDLTAGSNEYKVRLTELNSQYQKKFGFPFITALVRHQNIHSVLSEFEDRLTKDRTTEIEQAINQIISVSLARIRIEFGNENESATQELSANK